MADEKITSEPPASPLYPGVAPPDAVPAPGRDPSLNGTPPAAAAKPADAPASPFLPWLGLNLASLGFQLAVALAIAAVAFLVLLVVGFDVRRAAAYGGIVGLVGTVLSRYFLKDPFAKPAAQVAPHAAENDTAREVVETVVFVVVLVLMLRSFVAEAFVIPTGSMATTLYGYQFAVKCPQCDETFQVNASSEADPQDGRRVEVTACKCPNCLYPIAFQPPHPGGLPKPIWNSGDRVLVAKFVYDLFGVPPDRLDVVVFKYPGEMGKFPAASGPNKDHIPINYIKRLVGLPGETIAIYRGDLYVLRADPDKPRFNDYAGARGDPEKMATLWQTPWMHVNDPEALALFQQGKFDIVRKSPDTLLAMARPVYDNDHQARDLMNQEPRWAAAKDSGWQTQLRQFTHAGGGNTLQWLRYRHLLRDPRNPGQVKREPELITDVLGYNEFDPSPSGAAGRHWVRDLMLECEVQVTSATGEFALELSRSDSRFRAVWDLATGKCGLYQIKDGRETKLAEADTAVKKPGTYRVRFSDFDEQLVVWVDGRLPFAGQAVTYAADRNDGVVPRNDLDPAGIGVKGAGVTVSHVKLWRDTFYTHKGSPGVDTADPAATRVETEPYTMYVQPGHFLCLGDNSPASSDGRMWGLVPERLLLGRAVMVYYPLDRAGKIR